VTAVKAECKQQAATIAPPTSAASSWLIELLRISRRIGATV
jgi:hypothetical protein